MVEYAAGTADKASNSIVGHRHFPAVAALWFAALLGLGSLAIRPALIESAVLSMRLDTLIAAAAPPLGMTARLLLALAMGGFGAVVGLILARKIAAPRDTGMRLRARDAHPDAPARRPLSAATDLAEDSGASSDIAGPVLGQRRRTLAISEAHYPTQIIDFAPLPGADRPFTPSELGESLRPQEMPETVRVPLALADLALSDSNVVAGAEVEGFGGSVTAQAGEPAPRPKSEFEAKYEYEDQHASEPESAPGLGPEPEPARTFGPAVITSSAAAMAHFPLGSLSLAELSTRLASALAGRRSRLAVSTAMALSELIDASAPAATPKVPATAIADAGSDIGANMGADVRFNAGDDASDHAGSDARLQFPSLMPRPAAAAGLEDEAEADHAPRTAHLRETLPPALRPVAASYDDDDADPEADRFALPPRSLSAGGGGGQLQFVAPLVEDAQLRDLASKANNAADVTETIPAEGSEPLLAELDDAEPESNDGAPDDSYSSLLDISVSALSRPGHVRIDDHPAAGDAIEPAVVFPGQFPRFTASAAAHGDGAAPTPAAGLRRFDPLGSSPNSGGLLSARPVQTIGDAEATERALRAALTTLQRMSGAA